MSETNYDVSAQSMQYRSDYYRTELITDYLAKNRPYPTYKILGSVSITPDDASAIKILWNRVVDISEICSLATGMTAINDGQEVDADFTLLLDGKEVSVTLNVPSHLAIAITVDAQNAIQLDLSKTPLLVTFNDQLTQDGYPLDIPQQQNLVMVTWSNQQIDYQMDAGFTVRLLLTQSSKHRLFLSALAFDGLCPGTSSGGGGQGKPKSPPQSQICASSPVPPGWIVVDNDWNPTACGNPTDIEMNEVTIVKYDDKDAFDVGDTLWVCAAPLFLRTGFRQVPNGYRPLAAIQLTSFRTLYRLSESNRMTKRTVSDKQGYNTYKRN